MVTELGRDVIMPWLIQTWQAPITPPRGRERGKKREREGVGDGAIRGEERVLREGVKLSKNKVLHPPYLCKRVGSVKLKHTLIKQSRWWEDN